MLAVALVPHGERATLSDEATLSLELHTIGLLRPHVQVGSGGRTPG